MCKYQRQDRISLCFIYACVSEGDTGIFIRVLRSLLVINEHKRDVKATFYPETHYTVFPSDDDDIPRVIIDDCVSWFVSRFTAEVYVSRQCNSKTFFFLSLSLSLLSLIHI